MPRAEWTVHVRFEGRSVDIDARTVEINEHSSDQDVRQAMARYFDVAVRKFEAYVVERHPNGNITVRPEAVFGRT